jgi:hypothetical protein
VQSKNQAATAPTEPTEAAEEASAQQGRQDQAVAPPLPLKTTTLPTRAALEVAPPLQVLAELVAVAVLLPARRRQQQPDLLGLAPPPNLRNRRQMAPDLTHRRRQSPTRLASGTVQRVAPLAH